MSERAINKPTIQRVKRSGSTKGLKPGEVVHMAFLLTTYKKLKLKNEKRWRHDSGSCGRLSLVKA
jgi:hypothetical protein